MVKIALQIKATLENIESFGPEDQQSFGWNFKFRCNNCGQEGDNFNRIEQQEKSSIPGSRGEANLVIKCKLCSRVNSTDIVEGSIKDYTKDDTETFKTILQLECRGIEPVDYFFGTGFKVTCESGSQFLDVNLEDKEWVEYDEKAAASVGIYSLEHHFSKEK